MNELYKEFSTF